MLLKEIYDLLIKKGLEADPRGAEEVTRSLNRLARRFEEMKPEEKAEFDQERLTNPYDDTRVLVGDLAIEVNSILAGIDIDMGEILLADRLREKGLKIDLVLAHHPLGKALVGLAEVMHLQEDVLFQLGVPINIAEGILADRIGEVHRGLLPLNHNKTVDGARILNLPLMCVHTPADNQVYDFLNQLMEAKKPDTVGMVLSLLKEIPEYRRAIDYGSGPEVVVGDKDRRAGKIFVDMTGGTSGPENAYEQLAQAGIGTIVGMHMNDKHRKEAEKHHTNVIIAGHMASDSLGMNLLLDALEAKGINVMPCSGLERVKRV